MVATLNVVRADNGTAQFTYKNGTTTFSASGYWDDATPWASGSYALDFAVKSNTGNSSFMLENVEGNSRTGIMIHAGSSQMWSQGCLIVSQSFIDKIYADSTASGIDTGKDKPTGIDLTVSGDWGAKLNCSPAKASVNEGEAIQLTISIDGTGGADGVSKDIYVKLGKIGGTATEGSDFAALNALPDSVTLSGYGAGWIKIPAGQHSVTVSIPTVLDNIDTGTEAPFETAAIGIVDYRIINHFNKGDTAYKDGAASLLSVGPPAAVQIVNVGTVAGSTISASGGPEGYHQVAQFAPGQTVTIHFDPYTIPDEFRLTDSAGKVLLDTGFIGGRTFDTVFTVPGAGDGKLTIDVLTNNSGTAWQFQITPLTAPAPRVANGSLAGVANAPLAIHQNDTTMTEGFAEGVGLTFSVELRNLALAGHTIDWAVVGEGSHPATAADFTGGVLPTGSFAIAANATAGAIVATQQLPGAVDDGVREGFEGFKVVYRDHLTGAILTDAAGAPIETHFGIVDSLVITPAQAGTDGDDTLTGTADDDVLSGGLGNDTLDGAAGNDTLLGGPGNDDLRGGDGDDSLFPGFGTDTIEGGAGNDTVYLTAERANVAILVAADGSVVLDDRSLVPQGPKTLTGVEHVVFADGRIDLPTAGNDTLLGGAMDDTLRGLAGNDTIDGGPGADTMIGGTGDDVYYVGNVRDVVVELSGQGNDTVYSQVNYSLAGTFVETLRLAGSAAISATGNSQANTLIGNAADNVLTGLGGNDVLDGGAGADRMIGGTGDDTYYVGNVRDVVVELSGEGNDTVYSLVNYSLAGTFVETLHLIGTAALNATGNSQANTLIGNDAANILTGLAGNDVLDGGGGADTMIGGTGDDIYHVDNAGDVVTELTGEGNDTVVAGISYVLGGNLENLTLSGVAGIGGTGNDADNRLTGNDGDNVLVGLGGNDVLDGGRGADRMVGGTGDDIYYVGNVRDTVVEQVGEGNDTVYSLVTYSLAGTQVETLVLTGTAATSATGNGLDNTLTGNDAANVLTGLAGDDALDGRGGADTMIGGAGSDSYYVDNAGDVIVELPGEGNDKVYASVTYSLVGTEADNLALVGKAAIDGTGNDLSNYLKGNDAANTLIGLGGDDILNGLGGADLMKGGAGGDSYVVDNVGDRVVELANEGWDTVQSSVSFNLGGTFVEVLQLTGAANINATGNSQTNAIIGNSGDNVIDGKGGTDSLKGGLGRDTFVFSTGTNESDGISDFASGFDRIALSSAIFTGLAPGALPSEAFYVGKAAHDADDRIIFNPDTHELLYDADGTGSTLATSIARLVLTPNPVFLASDIVVF